MKRIFDLLLGVVILVFLVAPMLLISIAVRLSSKGPALYWSDRIGKNNVIFKMPKFRSMLIDTPAVATHLLDNPDTYIGSVENVDSQMWVYDDETNKIILRDIEYIPGLYKLFDEGIVNCRDHVIRMIHSPLLDKKFVTYIETNIDDDGTITMINDGNGIDVEKHPEYKVWIPELIFGHLRTSTNYNKDEKKIVGGKNGFGFKLVLIWSSYGYIETIDHVRKKKYCQEFKQNLDVTCDPVITRSVAKPYTKIVFKPDYTRFGIENLSEDMRDLLIKRVYDIAAITDKNIKVKYNDKIIPVKNFQQYIDLYLDDGNKKIHEEYENNRWEYAAALSTTHEFQQVSFVNGICTFKGGKHVDYILNQITKKMVAYIEKKKKKRVARTQEPLVLSKELCGFLKVPLTKRMSKAEVMKSLSSYIKDMDIQVAENKRKFKPNKELCKLFKIKPNEVKEMTFVEINKYIIQHVAKPISLEDGAGHGDEE